MRLLLLQCLVLRWLADGRTYLEIIEIEGLPYATVLDLVDAITRSLDVDNADDAIEVARRIGVI